MTQSWVHSPLDRTIQSAKLFAHFRFIAQQRLFNLGKNNKPNNNKKQQLSRERYIY